MLNLVRRLTSRFPAHEVQEERTARHAPGLVARMMQCDVNNLDRLARALSEHRR
jgi:hypothetical protein